MEWVGPGFWWEAEVAGACLVPCGVQEGVRPSHSVMFFVLVCSPSTAVSRTLGVVSGLFIHCHGATPRLQRSCGASPVSHFTTFEVVASNPLKNSVNFHASSPCLPPTPSALSSSNFAVTPYMTKQVACGSFSSAVVSSEGNIYHWGKPDAFSDDDPVTDKRYLLPRYAPPWVIGIDYIRT